MTDLSQISGYKYNDHSLNPSHSYLLPKIKEILDTKGVLGRHPPARVFDLGCGNGSVANELTRAGLDVTGIDASKEGIAKANSAYPNIRLEQASAYDDLASIYGTFDVVVSLEVIPHVFLPRLYAKTLYSLVSKEGYTIVSTPYHGYAKNLALAVSGQLNDHFRPLWDYGYVKFWSVGTLRELLLEVGISIGGLSLCGPILAAL